MFFLESMVGGQSRWTWAWAWIGTGDWWDIFFGGARREGGVGRMCGTLGKAVGRCEADWK